jgi:DHA2 family multidrug resistance protein
MELIDTSIVNVALSDISGNLGATIEDTSWVVTAYAIANVIIIPLTGFLAKYFGRKNYYIGSIILFTVASYACANSGTLSTLVIWRFIQGIGGGALLSTSQSILFDAFPPEKRGMASGMFGMGIVLGPAIGPALGGIIIDNYSWPLIFLINIPFGIVAVSLALKYIDKKEDEYAIDRKSIPIDFIGVSLLAVGVGSLQYVLEKGQSEDWFSDSAIRILTATATLGILSFIWWELKTKTPVIDLRVLKSKNLVASNLLTFVCGFGLFGGVFIFPVMVQRVYGYTPTDAGLGIVPGALFAILIMPIIGKRLAVGTPPVVFVVIGFIAFIMHGYSSSLSTPDSGKAWFIVPQIYRGIGAACLTVPLINQAVIGLKPQEMPYGIALTNMLRQLGGAFGIAVMNTYVTIRYAVHRTDLVANLATNDPELQARLSNTTTSLLAKGISPLDAPKAATALLEFTINKQSYLCSYLDAYRLICVFFLCAFPLILLLENKSMDAQTRAKVAEESH